MSFYLTNMSEEFLSNFLNSLMYNEWYWNIMCSLRRLITVCATRVVQEKTVKNYVISEQKTNNQKYTFSMNSSHLNISLDQFTTKLQTDNYSHQLNLRICLFSNSLMYKYYIYILKISATLKKHVWLCKYIYSNIFFIRNN